MVVSDLLELKQQQWEAANGSCEYLQLTGQIMLTFDLRCTQAVLSSFDQGPVQ